jgi:DNA-binding IclR family transcriptional regulator
VPVDAVAESIDELEVGLASIAAAIPLRGHDGAYVTVSGPSFRFDAEARTAAGGRLLDAVAGIADRIASNRPESHRRAP